MQTREFEAAQDFLLAAKKYWTTEMYRSLRGLYQSRLSESGKPEPKSVGEVANILEGEPTYQYFSWLERHIQRLKYTGPYGLVPYFADRRQQFLSELKVASPKVKVTLDDTLKLPDYYSGIDTHQHLGGLWSDEVAGVIYERGARTTTPLLGEAHATLHDFLADFVQAGGPVKRLLDLGCGFGKSTRPFAEMKSIEQVIGIDLSAPCLKVAGALTSPSGKCTVEFRQMDVTALKFDANSFDVVTSTMLLHEISPKAVEQLFREAFRVLRPGGRMVHLDFWRFPSIFRKFLHYGHGQRNNEPFMIALAELNLPKILADIGFTNIAIEPFSETGEAPEIEPTEWRFPWTTICASKPA